MLVSFKELKDEWQQNQNKLRRLMEIYRTAPAKFTANTGHLGSPVTLFPYLYHTRLVKKYLADKTAKILDWGAYLGQITYLLQDDYSVNAYNPTPDADIKFWHKQLKIKTASFDKGVVNYRLEFSPESFDAVISSGVLEHSFERGVSDIKALKNLNQVLKPEGLLFIWNLPTKFALAELTAVAKKKWKHVIRYSLDEITYKLNLAGFEIVAIERSELLFSKLAQVVKFIPLPHLWRFDYWLTQWWCCRPFAHHFTIVARKIKNFPLTPAVSSYTTYA